MKNVLYFSVNVLSKKNTDWGHYFTSPTGDGTANFTWSYEPREGLAACRANAVPSFF